MKYLNLSIIITSMAMGVVVGAISIMGIAVGIERHCWQSVGFMGCVFITSLSHLALLIQRYSK